MQLQEPQSPVAGQEFRGKVAVVTGAARGIGFAIAQAFGRAGAQVVLVDADGPVVAAAARRVHEEATRSPAPDVPGAARPSEALAVTLDLRDDDACRRAVEQIVSQRGAIHVLVNNAGIYRKGDVRTAEPAQWHDVLGVNVTGAFLLTRHVVPHMIRQGGGAIVNIGSEAGLVAIPNQMAYNVSKAAIIMFTRSLAVDLAPYGIRANCVCPGTTWTPLVEAAVQAEPDPAAARRALEESRPLRRLGRPEEIAAAVLCLASDTMAYATGAVLSVDGGYTAQ